MRANWHGSEVAIKFFKNTLNMSSNATMFRKEIALLSKLRHPHIVLFMGHVIDGTRSGIGTSSFVIFTNQSWNTFPKDLYINIYTPKHPLTKFPPKNSH
jgi:hypothetical protein